MITESHGEYLVRVPSGLSPAELCEKEQWMVENCPSAMHRKFWGYIDHATKLPHAQCMFTEYHDALKFSLRFS